MVESAQIRVLVVDDFPVVVAGMSRFLEMQPGFDVVGSAHFGEAALLAVEQLQPDLVLMDIQMPGINGLEACAAVRKRFPQVCVILTSVEDGKVIQKACVEAGAHAFLIKSEFTTGLVPLARRLLGREPQRAGAGEPAGAS